MENQKEKSDPAPSRLRILKEKLNKAMKRLERSIEVQDRKYKKELMDYELRYGKLKEE